jgi:hypothetical protein
MQNNFMENNMNGFKIEIVDPPKEISKDSLAEYLAQCMSVVRGKEPRNNIKLWNRLMKESYGDKPSRAFELIPCVVDISFAYGHFYKAGKLFGYKKGSNYYTNMRELLNWGWSEEKCFYQVDFTHYRTFKCVAQYYAVAQIQTHNQITSILHSNRYTESQYGYWYPEEFEDWYIKNDDRGVMIQDSWNEAVETFNPVELEDFMKNELGVKRREIFSRGSDSLRKREFVLGGSTIDPYAWEHFVNQRLDPHTQKETREITKMIKGLL